MMLPPLPSDAALFVPHRDTMLLLETLEKVVPDLGQANAVIKSDNIFFDKKTGLDPVAFIELMAQTAAAYNGYEDLKKSRNVRTGLLVGIKNFRLMEQANKGDVLQVEIRRTFEISNATVIEGKVTSSDQKIIAAGTLNLWILDETPPPSLAATNSQSFKIKAEAPEWLTQNRNRSATYILEHLQVLNKHADELNAAISFGNDFAGFNGHFPDTPILPGIVLLQTASISSEVLLQKRLILKSVEKVKFMGPVLPNQLLKIICSMTSKDSGLQSRVHLGIDDKKVATMVLEFEAEND